MNDATPSTADRERQLMAELDEVQREIGELFAVDTQPLQGKPLSRDERTRLHARREKIRAELDELRARRSGGQ